MLILNSTVFILKIYTVRLIWNCVFLLFWLRFEIGDCNVFGLRGYVIRYHSNLIIDLVTESLDTNNISAHRCL